MVKQKLFSHAESKILPLFWAIIPTLFLLEVLAIFFVQTQSDLPKYHIFQNIHPWYASFGFLMWRQIFLSIAIPTVQIMFCLMMNECLFKTLIDTQTLCCVFWCVGREGWEGRRGFLYAFFTPPTQNVQRAFPKLPGVYTLSMLELPLLCQ